MKTKKRDVIIIGGGPGGYVAAPILAEAGLTVTCIELEVLGGVCLKWGCMPTKSLASVAHTLQCIRRASEYGITVEGHSLDFDAVHKRMKGHVEVLERGCVKKFAHYGVELIMGHGSLVDEHTVLVKTNEGEEYTIQGEHIIINTGSSSIEVPPFNGDPAILDNVGILSLKELPKSLLVVGSGVMGCEFASIFANFGSEVTMIDLLPRILSSVDEDTAEVAQKYLQDLNVKFELGTKVASYERTKEGFSCVLTNGKIVETEQVLCVVGRRPNSAQLGLDRVGVNVGNRGQILVNKQMQTSVPSIYAIGDVIGNTYAHVSRLEGELVARHLLKEQVEMDYRVVPWAIFMNLEISGVGHTEETARAAKIDFISSTSKFSSNGKAMVSGEPEGFAKMIIDRSSKQIIGMQIIGPHASDLIHEIALAMRCSLSATDVAQMIHIHPTLGESVLKTAQQLG